MKTPHRRIGLPQEALQDLNKAAALGYRSAGETLRSLRIDW